MRYGRTYRAAGMTAALNITARLYLDSDGRAYPVTNWFDADGDECAPEEAVAAVAGEGDRWFSFAISDFEGVPTQ